MAEQKAVLTLGTQLLQGTTQAFRAVADGFRSLAKGMDVLATGMRSAGTASEKLKVVEESAIAMSRLSKELDSTIDGLERNINLYSEATAEQKKLEKQTDELIAAKEKEIETLEKQEGLERRRGNLAAGDKKRTQIEEKKAEIVGLLRLRYDALFKSESRYADGARASITSFKEGSFSAKRLTATLTFLNRRQKELEATANSGVGAYKKMESELSVLTSKYPKLAAMVKATGKSYSEQIAILKRVEAAEKVAAKKAAIYEKQRAEAARLRAEKEAAYAEGRARLLLGEYKRQDNIQKKELAALSMEEQGRLRLAEGMLVAADKVKKAGELEKRANEQRARAASKLRLQYDSLITSTDKFGKASRNIHKQFKTGRREYDSTADALANLNKRQQIYLKNLSPLNQAIQRVGRSFKTYMSYAVASSVIFGAIQTFREMTTAIIEYDQSLKDLQAITLTTDEDTKAMGERIKQVASDTKFSANEVAGGMKLLVQAGLTAEEAIAAIGPVADLATGTLSDFETTVDLVTTTLRVFDISAEESTHIVDVWGNAINRSKLTVDKVRTALNYVGPVAHALGINVEQLASSMMMLANQGLRASTIGTGLRQVFRRLVDPTREFKAAVEGAGMTMDDMNPQVVGLTKVYENLRKVVLTAEDAFSMFKQRGATAVLAITQGGDLNALLDVVQRVGTAADMAAIQMEGLGVSFKNLKDKIGNLYIAIGENGITGLMRVLVDVARGFVDFLTGVFSNSINQWIIKIGAAATAIALLSKSLVWLQANVLVTVVATLDSAAAALTTYIATVISAASATDTFTISLDLMTASLSSTPLLGAFIVALGYLAVKMSTVNDRLSENIRELKAQVYQIDDNIYALSALKSKIDSMNGADAYTIALKDKLITKYSDFRDALEGTGGEVGKLSKVIGQIIDKEKELKKSSLADLMAEQTAKIGVAVNEYAANTNKVTKWMREIFTFGMANTAEAASQNLKDMEAAANEVARTFIELKKLDKSISLESVIDNMGITVTRGFSSTVKDQVKLQLQQIATDKAIADATRAAGDDLGAALAEGLKKGLDSGKIDTLLTVEAYENIKKKYADMQLSLKIDRALGVRDAEEADRKILENSIAMYDELAAKAKKFRNEAATARNKDDALVQKHANEAIKYEKQAAQKRIQILDSYARKRESVENKIQKDSKKKEDEDLKYLKNINKEKQKIADLESKFVRDLKYKEIDINKKVANKLIDIEKAKQDKLKSLRLQATEAYKSAENDILDLRTDLKDKILAIQQQSMSDTQKEISNRKAAEDRYATAIKIAKKAKAAGDKDSLKRSEDLLKSAENYYNALKDPTTAISGLKKVTQALIEVRQAQYSVEKAAIDKKIAEAKREAEEKKKIAIEAGNDELEEWKRREELKVKQAELNAISRIEIERNRHEIEMANIDAEIKELERKLQVLKAIQLYVANSLQDTNQVPETKSGGGPVGYSGGPPVVKMASGGRLPGQDSKKDKVPVVARPGEWFIKNESVSAWAKGVGDWFMRGVNWPDSEAGKRIKDLMEAGANSLSGKANINRSAATPSFPELGIVNLNLPTSGPPVPVAVTPVDAAELMRQFKEMERRAS